MRLAEEDGQGFNLVTVGLKIAPEILGHGLRVLVGVAFPFGTQDGVQAFVVNGLFLVAADGVDQLDQLPVEDGRGVADQVFPRLVVSRRRRLRAFGHGLDLARLLVDAVRIDG